MSFEPTSTPRLFYDLGSPYSWLAFERARAVMGMEVHLEPILIGGIFLLRDRGSWSQTDDRAANIAEIEHRADAYGLGPVSWPPGWPDNTLKAMRSTIWAGRRDRLEDFTRVAFRKAFRSGEDLSDEGVLAAAAIESGLDPEAMLAAIGTDSIKEELRARTENAWSLGVKGAPTLLVGENLYYGDDRLEAAAEDSQSEDPRR